MAIFGHHAVSDHVFATVGHVGTQRDAQFGTRDRGGPTAQLRPSVPVTTTLANVGSMASVKVNVTTAGALSSVAPLAGSEPVRAVCAAALAPPDTQHASATKTTTIVRATAFMLLVPISECTRRNRAPWPGTHERLRLTILQPTGCG